MEKTLHDCMIQAVRENGARWSQKYRKDFESRFMLHCEDWLDVPVKDIGRDMLSEKLFALSDDGKYATALLLLGCLRAVFDQAEDIGAIEASPMTARTFKKWHKTFHGLVRDNQESRGSIEADILPCVIGELWKRDDEESFFLCLVALSVVRYEEAHGINTNEIMEDHGVWIIPKNRMKGGKKSHVVPLSTGLKAVLERLKAKGYGENGRLFGKSYRSKILYRLRSVCKKHCIEKDFTPEECDKLTVHGFRASFRSRCTEKDFTDRFPQYAAEEALAHVIGVGAEKNYLNASLKKKDHQAFFLPQRTQIMQEWSELLLPGV